MQISLAGVTMIFEGGFFPVLGLSLQLIPGYL